MVTSCRAFMCWGDLIGSLLLAVAQNLLVGWLGEMMEFLIVVENAVGVEDLQLVAGLVVDAMSSAVLSVNCAS